MINIALKKSSPFLTSGFFGIATFFLLIIFKDSHLFFTPTLMNDDLVFFKMAFEKSPLLALFEIPEKYGYWNVWVRLWMLAAAKLVPLEYAPYVVMAGALALYAILAWAVMSSASPFASSWGKVAALWLVALFPMTAPFLMLNYMHFYMGAIIVLLLLSHVPHKYTNGLLLLLGLSSPLVLFLWPAFLLKYWRNKTAGHQKQVLITSLCCVVHAVAYYCATTGGGDGFVRTQNVPQEYFGSFIMWIGNVSLVNPFLGQFGIHDFAIPGYYQIGKMLLTIMKAGGANYGITLIALAVMLTLYFGYMVKGININKEHANILLWLLFIFFLICIGTYVFASEAREFLLFRVKRYALLPTLLIMWMLVLRCEYTAGIQRRIFQLLIVWMLVFGFLVNWQDNHPAYQITHSWKEEVLLWKENPDHALRVLPKGYKVRLRPPAI